MQAGSLVAGKYRIARKLGEGGMGSVWLAKNEVTERDFAIKFLSRGAETTQAQLTRFFQEAKVAGRLRHPSVVEIFDAGTEPSLGGAPYIVMEYLEGIGLDEAVHRTGGLPLGIALEVIAQIARALELAHDKTIIHRDLKPSNVYLHRVGNGSLVAKVLDFGISKVLIDDSTGRQLTQMTTTGALLGSPLYMSPEQAAGDKSIDARSDVHSLGVMLWQCLTGNPPFLADTCGLLLVEIIQGERPLLTSVLPSVPPGVSALVARAMARDRSQRYANAGEFAQAIEVEMSALGHVALLSSRTGAAEFFRLLGSESSNRAEKATSTTAAVSVPVRHLEPESEATTGIAQARSETNDEGNARAPGAQPEPKARPVDESTYVPPQTKRAWLPIAALVGVFGLLGAGAIAITAMRTPKADPPPTGEPAQPPAAAAQPPEPTPGAVPTVPPPVEPAESASSHPEPSAPKSASTKSLPSKNPKTEPTKPEPAKTAAPKSTAGQVHHGVTSSGL